jgi:hypothetical protein
MANFLLTPRTHSAPNYRNGATVEMMREYGREARDGKSPALEFGQEFGGLARRLPMFAGFLAQKHGPISS